MVTHSLVSLAEHDDTPSLSALIQLIEVTKYSSKLKLLRVPGLGIKILKSKGERPSLKQKGRRTKDKGHSMTVLCRNLKIHTVS